MRNIRILVFVALVSIVSCSKIDDLQDKVNDNNSFTAIIENDDDTKTSLDSLNVLWSSGDQVDVIYDKSNISSYHSTFTLSEGAGTKFGTFTGSTDLSGKDLFVLYPSGICSYSSTYHTIAIPINTNYNGNNIEIPMYGLGNSDSGVTFHHICCVIAVPLYAEPSSGYAINTVRLSNETGHTVSGRHYFNHSSTEYGISLRPNTTGAVDYIDLNCNGLTISEDPNAPTVIYFVVRGNIEFRPTITITLTSGDVMTKTKSSSILIDAGHKIVMNKLKVTPVNDKQMKIDNGTWVPFDPDSIGSISDSILFKSSLAVFLDSDVDTIMSKIRSQSSAVALDMSEARMLPSSTFPTLAQETISRLTSIRIPEGVVSISNGQFLYGLNAALTDIYFPSTINSFGSGSISGTPKPLQLHMHVDNPYFCDENGVILSKDKKTLVCFPAVNNTSSYTDYTVPSTVRSILTSAFCYAKYLQKLTIPASVTSISSNTFRDNTSLEEIVFLGHDAPTLSGTPNWASSPNRAPGYSVLTTKKLTIPSSNDVGGYNAARWTLFTGLGYNYYYWMTDLNTGAAVNDLGENNQYSSSLWEQ